MEANDHALAVALQNKFNEECPSSSNIKGQNSKCNNENGGSKKSLIDPEWELIDPNPDIFVLFQQFNKTFFWNALSMVEVKWSPRMTLCAGLCCYEGHGMLCSIRLSQPLLRLRPRKDLVETLLHEMIHAYLFVTANNKDRDGHGPEFCKHMHRINAEAGTNITIYHSFHNEVDEMRKHWWRCTGPCRSRPPYFGYVKRAMNRQPSKNDYWWNDHKKSCSGAFIKIKEPENYGKKTSKQGSKNSSGESSSALDPTQQTLKFKSKKPPTKTGGNVLGGALLPKSSNPRGIPLHSRLLQNLDPNTNLLQNKEHNALHKTRIIGMSSKVHKHPPLNRKKLENLKKVCQEMRRIGSQSVNEDAPAYSLCKTKTKFSTSKGTRTVILFDSDDELCSDNDVNSSPVRKKMENVLISNHHSSDKRTTNYQLQNDRDISLHSMGSGETSQSETVTCPVSMDDSPCVGVKRKYTADSEMPKSTHFRSPLKKKPNSDLVSSSSFLDNLATLSDLPSTSNSTFTIDKDDDSSLSDEDIFSTKMSTNNNLNDNFNNSFKAPSLTINADDFSLPIEVQCPVCTLLVPSHDVNMHIDMCLSLKVIQESGF